MNTEQRSRAIAHPLLCGALRHLKRTAQLDETETVLAEQLAEGRHLVVRVPCLLPLDDGSPRQPPRSRVRLALGTFAVLGISLAMRRSLG